MNRSVSLALWALMFGNFVIGAGVLAPAGLLIQLGSAFAVDVATVGSLIAYGAAVLCFEAPLLAFFTNKVDRRLLLTGSLVLYTVGHLVSAFAPSFAVLLGARLVMVAGAAVFTPQAASAVALFVPPERRLSAVTFIFLGWSLAAALGIPLVSLIGAHASWSAAYVFLSIACGVTACAVFATMPDGLRAPPLSLIAWKKVLSSGRILLIFAVTALSLAGQFVEYPFIAAELKTRLSAGPELIATLLAVYGVAGVLGATVSTAVIGRLGAPRTASAFVAAVLVGLAVWAGSTNSLFLTVLGLMVWGSGIGPSNSAQQARLIAADPAAASASVALNTSAIYVGQAIGTSLGGYLLTSDFAGGMGLISVSLVSAALVLSLLTYRHWRV